jgi:hypothetical protein
LSSSTQCLLFTDEINVKPEVSIKGPRMVFRAQPGEEGAEFEAVTHDPNRKDTSIRIEWFVRDGDKCPGTLDEALTAGVTRQDEGTPFHLRTSRLGPFCVWVIATDPHGARDFAAQKVEVINRPPKAVLVVMDPPAMAASGAPGMARAVLYNEIHLKAQPTDEDGDPLELRWTFTPPPGPAAMLACAVPPTAKEERCVRVALPGDYRYELRVHDGYIESEPATLTITAMPDAPPCIKLTQPQFDQVPRISPQANEVVTFTVLQVQDDGDPFPSAPNQPSLSSFVWQVRRGTTGKFARYTTPFSTFNILPDGTYGPGDVVQVRAEYYDRVKDRDFSRCNDEAASCALVPGCFQWVGWTVVFR